MENTDSFWVLGHKISPVEVSGDYDMVKGETGPKVPGPPPHYHTNMCEMFLVTEGEMQFVVNGESKTVRAGETIDLPPHVLHTFRNDGDVPCKWVNIHSPKGFLSFFNDLGVAEDGEEGMRKSVEDHLINRVIKEAIKYDMHIKMQ